MMQRIFLAAAAISMFFAYGDPSAAQTKRSEKFGPGPKIVCGDRPQVGAKRSGPLIKIGPPPGPVANTIYPPNLIVTSQGTTTSPNGPAAFTAKWSFPALPQNKPGPTYYVHHINICIAKLDGRCGDTGSLVYTGFACSNDTIAIDPGHAQTPAYPLGQASKPGLPDVVQGPTIGIDPFQGSDLTWRVQACAQTTSKQTTTGKRSVSIRCGSWSNLVRFQWQLPAPLLNAPANDATIDRTTVQSTGFPFSWSPVVGAGAYVICLRFREPDCPNANQLTSVLDASFLADCSPGNASCSNANNYLLKGAEAAFFVDRYVDSYGSNNNARGNWIVKACKSVSGGTLDCLNQSVSSSRSINFQRPPR